MPDTVPLHQVDAFTQEPLAGNPAAVCLLEAPAPEPWMQAIAQEMNLSETAFLHPQDEGHHLRWFTPTREVDLCGHATLASAHTLWETGRLDEDEPAVFDTLSGQLTVRRSEDGWITMDLPAEPADPQTAPPGLAEALDAKPVRVATSRLDLLAELTDEAAVRALDPDHKALAELDEHRGIIVTAAGDEPGTDYVCRYFAPAYGIDEDPVTGSIQCTLGPWWGQRLAKAKLTGQQLSPRGGLFQVEPREDRVEVAGQAVTVLTGHIVAPARG